MSKINLSDFLTMAKSGWTPQAFNDALDRLEKLNEEQTQDTQETESQEQTEQQESQEQPDEKDAKIIELEKKIKEMQQTNINQDMSDANHKTDEDIIDEMLRNFL